MRARLLTTGSKLDADGKLLDVPLPMLQGIADAFARVKSRKNYLPPVLPLHMGGDDKDNLDQAEGVVADVWLEGETLWGRLDRLQESFLNAIAGIGDSHTPYLSVRIVPPGHPYNADQGEDWFLSHVARVPYPGDPNIGSPVDFLGSVNPIPPDTPPDTPLNEPDMTKPEDPKPTVEPTPEQEPDGQQEATPETNPDLNARLQALEERLNQLTPEPEPEPEPEPVALAGKLSGHFQDVGGVIISAYRSRLAGLVKTGSIPKASIPDHLGALSGIYLGQRALREIGYNFSGDTGVKEKDPIEAYFQALEGQEGIKPGSPDVAGDRPSDFEGKPDPEPDPLVLSQQQANERLRQAHLTVLGKN